jgi:DNA-binding beta-propeller fold protein YncE
VYITDSVQDSIRVVNITTGKISTLATGLHISYGVAVDNLNNKVYASSVDSIIEIDQISKVVRRIAGTYICCDASGAGYSGDGGDATKAKVNYPRGLAIDTVNSKLYIAELDNHLIRTINLTDNIIDTLAGDFYVGDNRHALKSRVFPHHIAIDSVNNLVYILETMTNSGRIRVVNRTSNVISLLAGAYSEEFVFYGGGDGKPAINAVFHGPRSIAVENNLVYIADSGKKLVRVVNRTSGIISTFAGESGSSQDNGPATRVHLFHPAGLAIDSLNNLVYIANSEGGVRVVNRTTGILLEYATNRYYGVPQIKASIKSAEDIQVNTATNVIYFADIGNRCIMAIDRKNNIISMLVSNIGDTKLAIGISIDQTNNLVFYTDPVNHVVRAINPVTMASKTIAGVHGVAGYFGNTTNSLLNTPSSVAFDSTNNLLYIADTNNGVLSVD